MAAGPSNAPQLRSIFAGLLSGGVVATLVITWRLDLTTLDAMLAGIQMVMFLLVTWLLSCSSSSHTAGSAWLINLMGMIFMIVRSMRFIKVSAFEPVPPPEWAPIFADSPFGYAIAVFCIAESFLTQVLLHRMVPGWACNILAAVQAHLFSLCAFRYVDVGQQSGWQLLRIISTHQAGMFAPYHFLNSKWLRERVIQSSSQSAGGMSAKMAGATAAKHMAGKHMAGPHRVEDMQVSKLATATAPSTEEAVQAATATAGSLTDGADQEINKASKTAPVVAVPELCDTQGLQQHTTIQARQWPGSSRKLGPHPSSVQELCKTPYKSRLRIAHQVCVKLDTDIEYTRLPPDMAMRLQDALHASIGRATALSISDIAVRPGCICVTMKIDEVLEPQLGGATEGAGASLSPTDMANALLPELQAMLSSVQAPTAFQHATVQVNSRCVSCTWSEGRHGWDTQAAPSTDDTAERPWLGVALASAVQPTAVLTPALQQSGLTTYPLPTTPFGVGHIPTGYSKGMLNIVAEVQLWGVSKVADVEGWTAPQQHQVNSDRAMQWPGSPRRPDGSPMLKLLARTGGGYLSTQVLRLVPHNTSNCVIAQVVVQLHEQQLLRHHPDCAPSTLLLLDLELWQNEVLLSSSPLLSLPATTPHAAAGSSNAPALSAWWWGATDSAVAAAVAEVEACVQLLMADATEDAAATAQTCVQWMQDFALWLMQVQRVARTYGLCRASCSSGRELRQLSLTPLFVQQLGQQLAEYTDSVGLHKLHAMLQQMLRSVVQPAAATAKRAGGDSRVSARFQTVRNVLLGYPCRHDEQLYKQQLAKHLSGVLLLSSTFCLLICTVWVARSLYMSHSMLLVGNPTWVVLHSTVLVMLLIARVPRHGSQQTVSMRRAYLCIVMAYMCRALFHLNVALGKDPAPSTIAVFYQTPHLRAAAHIVLMLCEQVPASVVLPTAWLSCTMLLLELPAVMVDFIHGSGWHPAISCTAALLLVVGSRLIVDAHLRKQLAPKRQQELQHHAHLKTQ